MSYTRDEVLVTIDNVKLELGGRTILDGIDLEVHNLHVSDKTAGQVIGILGPSGVGKSQMLRVIACLQKPTSGGVYLDPDRKPAHRGMVGMVFQRYPLFGHRTVLGNLVQAGLRARMSREQASQKAHEYLCMFELDGDGAKYPAELSGGMQQRVAICQMMMVLDGPRYADVLTRLLLMDEPFSALDHYNTHVACELVRRIADLDDMNTIMFVTHDVKAALRTADILIVLGHDRDSMGNVCSGGKIKRQYDLIERGLPWHPEVDTLPEFIRLEQELVNLFRSGEL